MYIYVCIYIYIYIIYLSMYRLSTIDLYKVDNDISNHNHPLIHIYIDIYTYCFHLFIYLFIYLFMCLFVYLFIHVNCIYLIGYLLPRISIFSQDGQDILDWGNIYSNIHMGVSINGDPQNAWFIRGNPIKKI